MTELALKHGLTFADLYERDGLIRLDRAFVAHLAAADAALHDRLMAARAAARCARPQGRIRPPRRSGAASRRFYRRAVRHRRSEVRALQATHDRLAPLYSVKRLFVQRRAVKEVKEEDAHHLNGHRLAAGAGDADRRSGRRFRHAAGRARLGIALCRSGCALARRRGRRTNLPLKTALEYAAWATLSPAGRARHKRGLLFRVPHRLDMHHLVPVETIERHGVTMLRRPEAEWRARDGFALTDPGTDLAGAQDEANYCIWCHNQQKDSCRSGLRDKDGGFRKTVFGVTLAGCPLDEKISEMNLVKSRGHSDRRARHRRRRQPALRRDRAPHLQRLHEGLHLSAPGPGRHPADRDPHPEGRAGAALGVRDLQPADALEPARSAPAVAEAAIGLQGAGRRARPGRVQPGASPDQ